MNWYGVIDTARRRTAWLFVAATSVVLLPTVTDAQLSREQILQAPAEQVQNSAMFQFGRTRYFDALVTNRGCQKSYRNRTKIVQDHFQAVTARLAKHFDPKFFDAKKPVDLSSGPSNSCDEATLWSFEDKVKELEAWADRAEGDVGQGR